MEKVGFSTKTYTVDKYGIVRHKKTGEILTVLGHPSRRQKFRLWWKTVKKEFLFACKMAARAHRSL